MWCSRAWPRASWRSLPNGVGQPADAVDFHGNHVALREEPRRVEADSDARRRARGDDVAGHEGNACRDGGDEGRNVEDQVGELRVLSQLAIDPASDSRRREINFIGGDTPGPHGSEGV